MSAILSSLRNTVIAGFVLAAVVFLIYLQVQGFDATLFWPFLIRWLHVICGVMWIGLLWYFNFVSTPTMPKIPDELKPALGKYITPAALFWFRWGAMGTIFFGMILAYLNGYLVQAYTLDAIENFTVPKMHRHRHRHVAGHDHVVQCLVHHLAEPAEGAEHRQQISGSVERGQGRGGENRRAVQPHQHAAVDPHAVLHGLGAEHLLIASRDRA